jgi:hypothetical protein
MTMTSRRQDVDHSIERRLRDDVERRYSEARRLVYDAPAPAGELTERQQRALDELHTAELALRGFRDARRLDPYP